MDEGLQVTANDKQILTDTNFYWRHGKDGVRVLVSKRLGDAGFANGFSTRLGGVSPFPKDDLNLSGFDIDERSNIEENRRRFLETFGGGFSLATVWQVHGSDVKIVDSEDAIVESDARYDALVSKMTGVLVAVKTADCIPVLLADPRTGAFAAVHSGWRGTSRSITLKALDTMSDKFSVDPADVIAAIGPAADACCYEVGQDVYEAVGESDRYFTPTREGHWRVDLKGVVRDHLVSAGVGPGSIDVAPYCTIDRTDLFFSYRVEKGRHGRSGRLLSAIGRPSS